MPTDQKEADRQNEQLRALVVGVGNGDVELEKAEADVRAMIQKDAQFLEGYTLLAEIVGGEDDEKAEKVYLDGYQAALKVMPKDFNGPLDAENTVVQCFLRCHTGFVESLAAKGQYKEAIAAARRQLMLDPGDLFERERELGEMHIMDGQYDEARRILEEQAKSRATALYSLAYIDFLAEKYAEAAARLRQAFLLAPYAADFITGRMTSPNLFWQAGPRAPQFQDELMYVETLGGEIWTADNEARAFMEWLSQTSAAMGDRAAMAAISEKSFAQGEAGAKEADEFMALWNKAGVAADALVQEVKNPESGEKMRPWELLAVYHDQMSEENGFYEEEEEDGCGCGCGGHDHRH
ncbi:MAG: hypothetical protein LBV79_10740 [Candidatus Adiutrix sp.]|nr:hypothetical protein [Candidatus Adiutrix sp.]